jgi:lipopolysaccharide export system protein LptC
MVKKFITPSLLVLVAVLSWWYIKTLDKSLSRPPAVATTGPDYFMYDTVSTLLDEAGEPKHRLETAYLAHFPEDNRTELKDAHLTLHQPDGSLWSVKANQGTLYQETEQIYLAGDVVIEQPATADSKKAASQEDNLQTGTQKKRLQETGGPRNASQAGLRIETDRLHIDPNLQIAQTTDPVVISRQDARVNAIGMKANLQTNSVELLAKVKGIYVPPPEQSR